MLVSKLATLRDFAQAAGTDVFASHRLNTHCREEIVICWANKPRRPTPGLYLTSNRTQLARRGCADSSAAQAIGRRTV